MIREKHKRTVQRLQWLVQVRWLVVATVILLPLLLYFSKCIPLRITPFYFIGGIAFFYNLLAWLYTQKIKRDYSAVINNPEAFEIGRLTISLGIASFPEDAETASELIDKVDEVLYLAKRSGRNKACLVDKSGGGLYCTPGSEQNAG